VLSTVIAFEPARDTEIFAALPAAPAVFLLRGEGEPYVSKSSNLRQRLTRMLGPAEERSRKLNLRERVSHIEYTVTGSDFENRFLLYATLRAVFPETYNDRIKVRLSPVIKFNLENPYPRAYVTRRIAKLGGKSLYYGPFPARTAAEKFLNAALDLFKIRRCVEDLNPDPAFPGCIYSEMKMCHAPCFKGCTDDVYMDEVARARRFFDSNGESLLRELGSERDAASAAMEFEKAATLHQKIDKAHDVAALKPAIVRRLDLFNGVMLQPCADKECVNFFIIKSGQIAGPFAFQVRQQQPGQSESMEKRVQAFLDELSPTPPPSSTESMEHLAMLKHWIYRSRKTGELFLTEEDGELPLRRIVRGISRVMKGEKPQQDATESAAKEYWLARTRETEEKT
jgi:excinuclease ABC subunit C